MLFQSSAAAVLAAAGLDALIGDPLWCPHPVVLMGKLISCLRLWVERLSGDRPEALRLGGGLITAVLVLGAGGCGWLVEQLARAAPFGTALLVLGQLNIDLAPLIAGAGIGGLALGFGAQSVVKDFLSGLFMLIEDQYGVGDVIDIGPATGTVEEVSLRSTTLRDVHGTVWHIPNGEISRVGNYSQLWSRAVIDVEVAYDVDLRYAQGIIQRVADGLWEDPEWGGDELMERPEVWGIQNLGASGIAIRLAVKTEPSMQWSVEREIRLRVKEALDEAGIEIPFPQQTVWFRHQGDHPLEPPPAPATIETHEPAPVTDDQASD